MPAVLDLAAVGVVLGRYRPGDNKSPLGRRTVSIYLTESNPDLSRVKPGRFVDHPFPAPDYYIGRQPGKDRGGVPVWLPNRIPEIESWAQARVGPGVGGGRPYRDGTPARRGVGPPVPTLAEGYVACGECKHPIEQHGKDGCATCKRCKETSWTRPMIRGARQAAGLAADYTLSPRT